MTSNNLSNLISDTNTYLFNTTSQSLSSKAGEQPLALSMVGRNGSLTVAVPYDDKFHALKAITPYLQKDNRTTALGLQVRFDLAKDYVILQASKNTVKNIDAIVRHAKDINADFAKNPSEYLVSTNRLQDIAKQARADEWAPLDPLHATGPSDYSSRVDFDFDFDFKSADEY